MGRFVQRNEERALACSAKLAFTISHKDTRRKSGWRAKRDGSVLAGRALKTLTLFLSVNQAQNHPYCLSQPKVSFSKDMPICQKSPKVCRQSQICSKQCETCIDHSDTLHEFGFALKHVPNTSLKNLVD